MRNTKKAFTLVELIVVITILAILATIAFISLQGYSQDAKNSKVKSDLRSAVSAIETDMTKNSTSLSAYASTTAGSYANVVDLATTAEVGSGMAISTVNYGRGEINFTALGQNGDDFTDPNNGDSTYIFAYTSTGSFAGYQVLGTISENDTKAVVISGNYVQKIGTDAAGLFGKSADTGATGYANGEAY